MNEKNKINLLEKLNHELGLTFRNIDDKIYDQYLKNVLKAEETLYNNILDILTQKNLTDEAKQEKLENLSQQTKKYTMANDFSVPNIIKKVVDKIDGYTLDPSNLQLNEVQAFLPYSVMQKLSKKKLASATKQNVTQKKKSAIKFLVVGLNLFAYQKKSFGLFLCSTLLFYLRGKSQKKDNDGSDRKIILDYENDEFTVYRTALISTLANNFFEFFKASKPLVEQQFFKEACLNLEKGSRPSSKTVLGKEEKLKIVQNSLEKKKAEFYEYLTQDEELQELLDVENTKSGTTESEVGMLLMIFLEATQVIEDEGLLEKETGKGIKTHGLVRLSKEYIEPVFQIPFSPGSLPLIVRPKFWRLDSQNLQQNFGFGGFFFNEKSNTFGVINKRKQGIVKLTREEIESINYLQSNFYNVNKDYFNLMRHHSTPFIFKHLENFPTVRRFFELDPNADRSFIVRDISTFLESDPQYSDLKANLPAENNCKNSYRLFLKRKNELQQEYFNMSNALMEFIHIYCIADLFKDVNFYFALSIDGRGRFYYSSAGAGFGLQSGNLSANLIELRGNSYAEEIFLPTHTYGNIVFELNNKEIAVDMFAPNFYSGIKKWAQIPSTCVGIDASCSGTSIISGLIGFEKGMYLTNVIKDCGSQMQNKNCIYTNFQEFLRSEFSSMEKIFDEDFIKKQAQKEGCSAESLKEKLYALFLMIEDKLLIREHVKQFVMRQNYAQQNKGRSDYIYQYFVQPLVILDPSNLFAETSNRLLYSISYKLADAIGSRYKKHFPELDTFCMLVKTKIDFSKPLVLCTGNSEKIARFEIKQMEYKIIKTFKPQFGGKLKKSRSELSYSVPTGNIDKKKAAQGAVANFIHFLDSRLCSEVILKCRLNGIVLWCNHDCFYTPEENHNEVKKYYFEAYKKLLLESETLSEFFNANEIKNPVEINAFIDKTNKKKASILRSIENNEIEISEHILS